MREESKPFAKYSLIDEADTFLSVSPNHGPSQLMAPSYCTTWLLQSAVTSLITKNCGAFSTQGTGRVFVLDRLVEAKRKAGGNDNRQGHALTLPEEDATPRA